MGLGRERRQGRGFLLRGLRLRRSPGSREPQPPVHTDPMPCSSPPPSLGSPLPAHQRQMMKERVCAQTGRKCSVRDSHLAASMKTSRPGIAGRDPGGAPGDHTLQLPSRGEAPCGRDSWEGQTPATGLLCPRGCRCPGLSRTRRGGHGPGGSTGRGTPTWGTPVSLAGCPEGVPGDLSSARGDPSNFQSCCLLYGKDSKERKLQKSRDSLGEL